ncbi:unnamed protein product [Kuraishia capsulata CBS 1993]|uniref:Uncharacterized protein n=1 Tax=Kuraishia capsulata CBS 1993 TaxID=1382522 RepID=W6MSK6_9ASCO|nr:uncharacterized protein KUCA_T00004179001 [Kuraishia capsulata CBS 1993]CDK28197.1 unnamed protein product [Kuraishia capsulata CBS 1993]
MMHRVQVTKQSVKSVQRRLNSTEVMPPKLATTPNKYNSKSSAFNLKPNLPKGLHYHPAPSLRSPLVTPIPFLPDSDPRKSSAVYRETLKVEAVEHMPVIHQLGQEKYHLSEDDIRQMQQLRNEGWTRKQLTEKFKCSSYFVGIATTKNEIKAKEFQEQLSNVKSQWSEKNLLRHMNKQKQVELWKRNG